MADARLIIVIRGTTKGFDMAKVLTDRDLDETELYPESERVIQWRLDWLRAGGYSNKNARLIAAAVHVDWRFANNLLESCGDEKLAMRILF